MAEADPVGGRRGGGVISLCKRLLLPGGLCPSRLCSDSESLVTVASSRSSRASVVIDAPPTEPPAAPLTALQNAQPPADERAGGGRLPAPAAIAAHAAPTLAPAPAASAAPEEAASPGGLWHGRLRPPPPRPPPSRCCCMAARAEASPVTLPCISPICLESDDTSPPSRRIWVWLGLGLGFGLEFWLGLGFGLGFGLGLGLGLGIGVGSGLQLGTTRAGVGLR